VSNTNANWNGSEVVQKSNGSIVMVEFNYRVGLFGFLAGKDVQNDGDLNVGLLDQRALLGWVQQYIGQVSWPATKRHDWGSGLDQKNTRQAVH
jgi:acetylcholinesterase